MQSQLAAALLGQSNLPVMHTDDEQEADEADDVDEFIDEEYDAESGARSGKTGTGSSSTGRTVTLQMLLAAGILQPGEGSMSIEYLGQRFIGDLLPDGKIKSQETDIVFASPSAWAIHCKRIINPEKKSGCGWASVKYRGKKLDAYKNVWFKKKKEEQQDKAEENSENEMEPEAEKDIKVMAAPPPIQRIVVKHNTIANRTFTHDSNTLVECIPFSNLGKIQPFLVSMSTNAVLLMDFHCHLTNSEVCGYLAGQWDVNGHNLSITHAFPCRCTKSDRDQASQVEADIARQIEHQQLLLVGWYHSHPMSPAAPTLRDVDAQLEHQIKMKGSSDSSYTPCVGVICSPYNLEHNSLESAIISYWVIPPPENKPNEYGRPMLMSYSVIQDTVLQSPMMEELKKTAEYYKKEPNFINFSSKYQGNTTYLEKFKTTLSSKFPRDQNDGVLWGFIKEIIGYTGEDNIDTSSLLAVPNISMKAPSSIQTSLSLSSTTPYSSAASLSSNLMLTSNIANVLFNSGKFPSATSLLGLPDPMAQSTLAANNMFLSPNLFKMQDTLNLLKPLSMSTPLPSTSKSDKHKKHDHLKPPTIDFSDLNSLKTKAMDYNDLTSLKNKLDFNELNALKAKTGLEYSEINPMKSKTMDFDFSALKNKPGLEFSDLTTLKSKLDFPELNALKAKTGLEYGELSTLKNKPTIDFSTTKSSLDFGDLGQLKTKTTLDFPELNALKAKTGLEFGEVLPKNKIDFNDLTSLKNKTGLEYELSQFKSKSLLDFEVPVSKSKNIEFDLNALKNKTGLEFDISSLKNKPGLEFEKKEEPKKSLEIVDINALKNKSSLEFELNSLKNKTGLEFGEIKSKNLEYDLTALKNKTGLEFAEVSQVKPKTELNPHVEYDLSSLKNQSFSDLTSAYTPDLALSSMRKMDFLASDLSISSVKPKVTESFSSDGPTPPKLPKTDFGMLDLSVPVQKNEFTEAQVDLTVSNPTENNSGELPLNLAE